MKCIHSSIMTVLLCEIIKNLIPPLKFKTYLKKDFNDLLDPVK